MFWNYDRILHCRLLKIPRNSKGETDARRNREAAGRWAGTVQLSVREQRLKPGAGVASNGRVAAPFTEGICKPWSSGCPSRQQPRVHQRWGPDPGGRTAGLLRCWCRRGRSLRCQTPEIQDVHQWHRCSKSLKSFQFVFYDDSKFHYKSLYHHNESQLWACWGMI